MRKPNPWRAGTSGSEVREAAREAARREGMSLSEWLAEAIGEYAVERHVDPADLNEEDRLEAVAARLQRLGVAGFRYGERHPSDFASERRQDKAFSGSKPRLARPASASVGARRLPRNERDRDEAYANMLLERAATHLKNTAGFETLARRLDQLEAELVQRGEQDRLPPVHGALARLESEFDSFGASTAEAAQAYAGNSALSRRYVDQLDRVESKVNVLLSSLGGVAAAPLSRQQAGPAGDAGRKPVSLSDAVAEIAQRQHVLETGKGATATPEPAGRRLNSTQQPPDRTVQADFFNANLASLRSDIAALAGKIEAMRREQADRTALPPSCNLDKLRTEIATMSDALRNLASCGSLAPLEAAIRNLTQQIEYSRTDGTREAVLRPLERLVEDLRRALAEIDPRTTIRGLEGEVRKLGSKLDDLGKRGFDTAALGKIDDRTREIRDLLAAAPVPVEKIERLVAALAERFDRLREGAARKEDGDLEAVADELRTLMRQSDQPALTKIETQLNAISTKVEEAIAEARDESHYTALANRINDIHAELSDSIAHGTQPLDQKALENLVRGLAQQLNEARAPQADNQAIEALQRQVSEFATRLDLANVGIPSLASIEQSISDLFAELERTREASYSAAERAARNVLQEALKHQPADNSDVVRDLVELRKMQDEAGRRTFTTLNAVHETLEKVVDRLAAMEAEIADVRTQKPEELLASGPAPNFTSVKGREPPPFKPSSEAATLRGSAQAAATRPKTEPVVEGLDDFLIEPGRGFLGRRDQLATEDAERNDAANSFESSDAAIGRAGFIAAARRAAQAAQMESVAAVGRAPAHSTAEARGTASLAEQTKTFIANHKRPLVLSVAALFLAIGAYAVVKTAGHAPPNDLPAKGHKETPVRPAAPMRQPTSEHRQPIGAPLAIPSAAAPKPVPPAPNNRASSATPAVDPIVTGSIGARPAPARAPSPDVLKTLAQAGDAKARYELASLYATGHGLPHDLKLAAHWYEEAARQGLAPAQYRLGSLYERGLGVERDVARAMRWYRKAAEAGNVRAMHNFAVLMAEGGVSGKPDYATAAQWFRKAAEYGVHDSQYNLAILLARGLGVAQNLPLSYTWFAVAAQQGDEDAGKKRDDVGARLRAADFIAAKAAAAAFRPKTPDPGANEIKPPAGGWVAPATQSHRRMTRPKISSL